MQRSARVVRLTAGAKTKATQPAVSLHFLSQSMCVEPFGSEPLLRSPPEMSIFSMYAPGCVLGSGV